MPPLSQTVRQRIVELLTGSRLSSYELAQRLGIPERQVEDHLAHVVKTVGRNRDKRFILEPSGCQHCGFVFRDRTKLTKPGRCPRCRSEGLTAPRYGVDASS